jgi:sporulation protein YlmC with PRC-barrel domain
MAITENNYEVDNRTGTNHEGRTPNIPAHRLTASSIIGDSVENQQGEKLGKIDNLMVNVRTGEIEYAVLEFGSFLGIGGKLFAIPFRELKLDEVNELFVLNRDKEYLKNAPGFDRSHWPDTNDHTYFDNVNLYYGSYVPPFP